MTTNWRSAIFTISTIKLLDFTITLFAYLEIWIISKISESSLITGILFTLMSVPYFFSYFTGTFIDMTRNKKGILFSLVFIFFIILLISQLELLSNNFLAIILAFYLSMIIGGIIIDGSETILSIWIKENVHESEYKKASSINRVITRSLRLIAVTLGGVLLTIDLKYSLFPPLIILGAIILLLLPIKMPSSNQSKTSLKQGFIEGFNYIRKNKVLTQFTVLTIENLFFNMQGILILYYVESFLHKGPLYFSLLSASAEIGIILGSMLAVRIKKGKLGYYNVIFRSLISASLVSYILIHNIFLAVVPTFVIFLSSGINSVLTSSALLRNIDKEYMGRTYGFIGVISNGLVTFSGPLGGIMILTLGVWAS
ncbi:MFS transporter [Acidianus ambivalens]|uniref:MFS transporter n=1 Tax=Acidianus ambivalens TaxID=2283 RepID=A0A650CU93_ACIAM|nr:MFS transporter [Acidianus ambivalens]MQL56046.1 MFS transporter [Acidianus ambivalens]QGR21399.1 MFS transporter [Acidianus ambivalens]